MVLKILEKNTASDVKVIEVPDDKRYADFIVVGSGADTKHLQKMTHDLCSVVSGFISSALCYIKIGILSLSVDHSIIDLLHDCKRKLHLYSEKHFGPRVYQRGSLVIVLVRPLISLSLGRPLNISETVHCFFLIFCMKLGHCKGTKVTELAF